MSKRRRCSPANVSSKLLEGVGLSSTEEAVIRMRFGVSAPDDEILQDKTGQPLGGRIRALSKMRVSNTRPREDRLGVNRCGRQRPPRNGRHNK